MLARVECCDCHFRMKSVGRRYRNHVNFRIIEKITPIARRLGKSEFGGFLRCEFAVHLSQRHQSRTGNVTEDTGHVIPCECVALAHIASANQSNA